MAWSGDTLPLPQASTRAMWKSLETSTSWGQRAVQVSQCTHAQIASDFRTGSHSPSIRRCTTWAGVRSIAEARGQPAVQRLHWKQTQGGTVLRLANAGTALCAMIGGLTT